MSLSLHDDSGGPAPPYLPPDPELDRLVEAVSREAELLDLVRVRVLLRIAGVERTIVIDRDDPASAEPGLNWNATSHLRIGSETVGQIDVVGHRENVASESTFLSVARLVHEIERHLLSQEVTRRAA